LDFNQLKNQVKKVDLVMLRSDDADYFEGVFSTERTTVLTEILNEFFGAPIWPSQKSLSVKVQEVIGGAGGIMEGQTLYFSDGEDKTVFAMIWPWRNGKLSTLKIAIK